MIPIRNIYYMLSYAFQVLNEQGYKSIETEQFDNVGELCAAILARGVSVQLKRGLGKEYIERTESLSSKRGKIILSESIKMNSILRRQLVCSYDDFSVNSYMNRIIKTTMMLLIGSDISGNRKKDLRKLLVYFGDVDTVDIHTINWNMQYNRNNQTYRMLISICYLIIKGLIQSDSAGNTKVMDFFDEQRMCRLYEKFILEYYRKEHKELKASASQIQWAEDNDFRGLLPVMQSDVMLEYNNKVLIIDAKYYAHTLQTLYDAKTVHSNNLYQIFTYVKNKTADAKLPSENVSGMLLYARTDEETQPTQEYHLSGNMISVRTLDLNQDFLKIKENLDNIVRDILLKEKHGS